LLAELEMLAIGFKGSVVKALLEEQISFKIVI
jgi:hypothetical protein